MVGQVSSSNSNSVPKATALPLAPTEFREVVARTNTLVASVNDGNFNAARQAAEDLFSSGQVQAAEAFMRRQYKNSLVTTLQLADILGSPSLAYERDLSYLIARILRLFAELTLIRAIEQSGPALDEFQTSALEKLRPLISHSKEDGIPGLKFELQCAHEAIRRWAGFKLMDKYRTPLLQFVIGSAEAALGGGLGGVEAGLALVQNLRQAKPELWYDDVLALATVGSRTASNLDMFQEIRKQINEAYSKCDSKQDKKLLLCSADLLADLTWRSQIPGVRKLALEGDADAPGLVKLASIGVGSVQGTKGIKKRALRLWRVRYHACCHLSSLRNHEEESVSQKAAETLSSRHIRETHEKAAQLLSVLVNEPPCRSYQSFFHGQNPEFYSMDREAELELRERNIQRRALEAELKAEVWQEEKKELEQKVERLRNEPREQEESKTRMELVKVTAKLYDIESVLSQRAIEREWIEQILRNWADGPERSIKLIDEKLDALEGAIQRESHLMQDLKDKFEELGAREEDLQRRESEFQQKQVEATDIEAERARLEMERRHHDRLFSVYQSQENYFEQLKVWVEDRCGGVAHEVKGTMVENRQAILAGFAARVKELSAPEGTDSLDGRLNKLREEGVAIRQQKISPEERKLRLDGLEKRKGEIEQELKEIQDQVDYLTQGESPSAVEGENRPRGEGQVKSIQDPGEVLRELRAKLRPYEQSRGGRQGESQRGPMNGAGARAVGSPSAQRGNINYEGTNPRQKPGSDPLGKELEQDPVPLSPVAKPVASPDEGPTMPAEGSGEGLSREVGSSGNIQSRIKDWNLKDSGPDGNRSPLPSWHSSKKKFRNSINLPPQNRQGIPLGALLREVGRDPGPSNKRGQEPTRPSGSSGGGNRAVTEQPAAQSSPAKPVASPQQLRPQASDKGSVGSGNRDAMPNEVSSLRKSFEVEAPALPRPTQAQNVPPEGKAKPLNRQQSNPEGVRRMVPPSPVARNPRGGASPAAAVPTKVESGKAPAEAVQKSGEAVTFAKGLEGRRRDQEVKSPSGHGLAKPSGNPVGGNRAVQEHPAAQSPPAKPVAAFQKREPQASEKSSVGSGKRDAAPNKVSSLKKSFEVGAPALPRPTQAQNVPPEGKAKPLNRQQSNPEGVRRMVPPSPVARNPQGGASPAASVPAKVERGKSPAEAIQKSGEAATPPKGLVGRRRDQEVKSPRGQVAVNPSPTPAHHGVSGSKEQKAPKPEQKGGYGGRIRQGIAQFGAPSTYVPMPVQGWNRKAAAPVRGAAKGGSAAEVVPLEPDVIPEPPKNYVPRANLERQLEQRLTNPEEMNAPVVCHGKEGMGKSVLAQKVLNSPAVSQKLPNKMWIRNSGKPERVEAQFHDQARRRHLVDDKASPQKAVKEMVAHIETEGLDKPFVIVFEDAKDLEALKPFMPKRGGTPLVLSPTSSRPNSIEVDALEPDESRLLIEKQLRRNVRDAKRLAEAFGHHPLGLVHACAYIRRQKLTIDNFLGLLKNQPNPNRNVTDKRIPDSIATLWAMTFDKLTREQLAMLDQLAYLANDRIPLRLLKNMGRHQPLGILVEFALVEKGSNGTYSMHGLVQHGIRTRTSHDPAARHQALTNLVNTHVFRDIDQQAREVNWQLLPHGEALTSPRYRSQDAQDLERQKTYASALTAISRVWGDLGYYFKAQERASLAVELGRKAYGRDHGLVAPLLLCLGEACLDRGNYDMANKHLEQAVRIYEKAYGQNEVGLAAYLSGLGNALLNRGNATLAEAKYARALILAEQAYGLDDMDVGTCKYNVGVARKALGDLDGAMTCYMDAFAVYKRTGGIDQPEVATCLRAHGTALFLDGRFDEGAKKFEQAVAIYQKVYSLNHPLVASGLFDLGDALRLMENREGAREKYTQAHQIAQKHSAMGPSHALTKLCVRRLNEL